jgi:cyclophilin family peptidyl-prolyl cis-trans isomerase
MSTSSLRSPLARLLARVSGVASPRAVLLDELESRSMLSITNLNPVADAVVAGGTATTSVSLAGRYDNTDLNGSIVKFATVLGDINVLLYDQANPGVTRTTPLTVANFLRYMNDGKYADTIFHRSASGFVIQGGGFSRPANDGEAPVDIATYPAVQNEPGNTNVRGTIAMAKLGGDPNSATSQWFFNLGDNASNLDNQNGGFTVFGRIIKGLDVMDAIAALRTWNFDGAFTDLPLRDHVQDQSVFRFEYVSMSVASISELTYSVTSSDPALAAPSLSGTDLSLAFGEGRTGTAQITVRVTCADGSTLDDVFSVRVNAAPVASNLVADPSVVDVDAPYSLTLQSVTDDAGVSRVRFYLDANDNGTLETETDTLLGTDSSSSGGWRLEASSTGLALGTHRFFAQAVDIDEAVSNVVSTTMSVQDLAPDVVRLTASPSTVARNASVTLTASNLVLPDLVGFRSIEFYADVNGNGTLQVSGQNADRRIGSASKFGSGVSIVTSTKGLPAGLFRYFARVLDTGNVWHDPVQVSVTITNNAPVIRSLNVSPTVVRNLGDVVRLSLSGLNDVDGRVVTVRYYREVVAGSEGLDPNTDLLLGTLTGSDVGRGLSINSSSFTVGVNRFYAVAVDNDGTASSVVTSTLRMNAAPVVGSFSVSPATGVRLTTTFTLSASSVTDADGVVRRVNFFLDVNGNGLLDARDRALGEGKFASGVWAKVIKPRTLPLGTMQIFAVATDDVGGVSAARSFQVTIG